VVLPAVIGVTEVVDLFKILPGLDRRHTPRSDYMFQVLQPMLEDLLFLGQSYEQLFDEFEVLLTLTFADLRAGTPIGHVWGPPGRFAWKRGLGDEHSPFESVLQQINREQADWGPVRAGLFQGDYTRALALGEKYRENILNRTGWS
jgi:hypothetical protein